jgi:hypothetical protein
MGLWMGLWMGLLMELLIKSQMTLDELTYKIYECAMKVRNTLGNGFQEVIYQRCPPI